MSTLSLCMIVKNEEEMLAGCLQSVVDLCEEIIIVDTGSTDRTKEIARAFTKNIFDFKWVDDFSKARNYAFQLASMDFIMWLDADDILLEKDRNELKKVKENLHESVDAVSMFYHTAFDQYGNPTFKFRRHRIVNRKNNVKWVGAVHEYLEVGGNIIHANMAITHRKHKKSDRTEASDRNIKIYENRLAKGDTFTPRDLFYYANELKDHRRYKQAIRYYEKFLNTNKGWVEDRIRAHIHMADCYRVNGQSEKEREQLIMTFMHDVPRPEVSCRLGDYYKEKRQYKKAIVWYELALHVDISHSAGFQFEQYTTWYPHLQLCACYWHINEKQTAYEHHETVKQWLPDDERVRYNEQFFEK